MLAKTYVVPCYDSLCCRDCIEQVDDSDAQRVINAQQEIDELIREGKSCVISVNFDDSCYDGTNMNCCTGQWCDLLPVVYICG